VSASSPAQSGDRSPHDEALPGKEATQPPPKVAEERAKDRSETTASASTHVVEIQNLHKNFGERPVLRGVSFHVERGKITTLIGGSGSGKTVVSKHILGLFKPTSGDVLVFGESITQLSPDATLNLRRRIGVLFQSGALFDSMTVRENVAFPLREAPRTRAPKQEEIDTRVTDVLRRLKVLELSDKLPSAISSGQRKRVGLARAIVTEPEIIIFDEPTTGLDPVMTHTVNDMIEEAQAEFGVTALVISHDMASTFRISHLIAMIHEGRIVAFGSPEDLQGSQHEHVQNFIFAGEFS
jgi:ABC-type transporter Mla maintaining outer membrane lipid asymmetry ATPase subunit MlaF